MHRVSLDFIPKGIYGGGLIKALNRALYMKQFSVCSAYVFDRETIENDMENDPSISYKITPFIFTKRSFPIFLTNDHWTKIFAVINFF